MTGDISIKTNLYIICGYTDMRRSIDGLCAIVQDMFHAEPDGMCLLYKRLDGNVQGRFRWPRSRNEVKPITWKQFDWLMSGLETEQPKALKMPAPASTESA